MICTSDDVRFPNVDDDEEKYGQIDQDAHSDGVKNAAHNIKGYKSATPG